MKIHLEYNGVVLKIERNPMPEGRFRALCCLALVAIAGGVLAVMVHMVGVPAIIGAVVALVAAGVYKLAVESFK